MLSKRLLSTVSHVAVRNFSHTKPVLATFTVQDKTEFKEKVLGSANPIMVVFSASWCSPCKLQIPRLDAAIAATEGAVDLATVDINIDELADIALEHGVNAVFTVVGIKEGQVVDRFVGFIDEEQVGAFINKLQS